MIVGMQALQHAATTILRHRTGWLDAQRRWFDDLYQPALGESMATLVIGLETDLFTGERA